MPDLSASRPSTPEEPKSFTEEDVEMLVQVAGARLLAMTGLAELPASRALLMSHEMRAVLSALSAAGRLLPASSEHREEWTYTATIGNVERHGEDNAEAYETRADVEQQVAFMRQHYPALPIIDVRYVRRDVFAGPWVDRSPTDA